MKCSFVKSATKIRSNAADAAELTEATKADPYTMKMAELIVTFIPANKDNNTFVKKQST